MMLMEGRLWRWPRAKSLGSWAGVTLTAPVPKSRLTHSSRMMGISRSDQRQAELFAVEMEVALVLGMDGDGGVAEHGLGAGGGDGQELAGFFAASSRTG